MKNPLIRKSVVIFIGILIILHIITDIVQVYYITVYYIKIRHYLMKKCYLNVYNFTDLS